MPTFRAYIPAFADIDALPPTEEFSTTEELLALPFVQRFTNFDGFSHFAMSGNILMKIDNGGSPWWVVGYVSDPSVVNLPEWDGGRHGAELAQTP